MQFHRRSEITPDVLSRRPAASCHRLKSEHVPLCQPPAVHRRRIPRHHHGTRKAQNDREQRPMLSITHFVIPIQPPAPGREQIRRITIHELRPPVPIGSEKFNRISAMEFDPRPVEQPSTIARNDVAGSGRRRARSFTAGRGVAAGLYRRFWRGPPAPAVPQAIHRSPPACYHIRV